MQDLYAFRSHRTVPPLSRNVLRFIEKAGGDAENDRISIVNSITLDRSVGYLTWLVISLKRFVDDPER